MQLHPARGVWIETASLPTIRLRASVAPRKGCVDGQMAAMIVVNGAKIIIVICAHKPLKKHR